MPRPNDSLNAFLDYPQVAVPSAQSGPLAGCSLGVKDIFDVAGYVTGWGNPVRTAEAAPAAATAPSVQALLDAGAQFAGKTQTEELAFSMIGQNVHFPHPINPAAPDRVVGGSSSGSAAAVAGGLVDIATGSDTGGSVRCPASFCGLVGLRTTHGAIPLDGIMPLASSFDTVGWFARDMDVYERVGEVYFAPSSGRAGVGKARFRLVNSPTLDSLVAGPAEAAEYARMIGVVTSVLGTPKAAPDAPFSIDELYWATRRLQAREAWASHGEWISSGDRKLGQATYDRFAFGKTVSAADAKAETARRDTFRQWLGDLLGDDGLLVMPTVPGAPPLAVAGAQGFQDFREQAIRLLCWSGLSGFPQITLPLGKVEGAPFGISLLGPPGSDLELIRIGREVLRAYNPLRHPGQGSKGTASRDPFREF